MRLYLGYVTETFRPLPLTSEVILGRISVFVMNFTQYRQNFGPGVTGTRRIRQFQNNPIILNGTRVEPTTGGITFDSIVNFTNTSRIQKVRNHTPPGDQNLEKPKPRLFLHSNCPRRLYLLPPTLQLPHESLPLLPSSRLRGGLFTSPLTCPCGRPLLNLHNPRPHQRPKRKIQSPHKVHNHVSTTTSSTEST